MNLSNKELVNELKKRVKEGTLNMQVTASEFETETSSLFSKMGTESKLMLFGLVIAFTLFICYTAKVDSCKASSCNIEFDCESSKNVIEVDQKWLK